MARQERKYHYIYKITCKITNRYYIGMHSTDNLDDGYFGSGKRLWFSINYHGKDNHDKEILEYCDSRETLSKREAEIVTNELISEDLCMNLVHGGQGGGGCTNFSEEKLLEFTKAGVKARIKKFNTDLEYQNNVIKQASINIKNSWSLDKFKHSKRFSDKQHSDETKTLMSEKAKIRTGDKNSSYGTCWITKEGINKKIKKEEIAKYTQEGWVNGRIL